MTPETNWFGISLVTARLCACTALAAYAKATPCETPHVIVDTENQELHGRVCDVVAAAIPLLEKCQLKLTSTVTISFSEGLGYPDEICIGLYHHGKQEIELLNPIAFEKALERSDFWTAIPVAEHYESIIVHELTHAHVDQATFSGPACSADWEYVAYVMQIASLSESTRDAFIESSGVSQPVTSEELNSLLLGFSPSSFAARAWLHFIDPENGCDFVGKITRGERTLMMFPE